MFFDGAIADDTSKIRIVGFDTLQQKELAEFNERQAVQLTEKRKQDVTISDASGSAKLVLWEEDIDCVRAYIMKNLIVRVYLDSKYLSKGVSTNIQQISDIGIVSCTSSTGDSAEEICRIQQPTIVGVPELETYRACLKCKSRVEPVSSMLGSCSNCRMMQRYDVCQEHTAAKVLIMYNSDAGPELQSRMMQVLILSEQMLRKWIGREAGAEVTQEIILKAPVVPAITITKKKKLSLQYTAICSLTLSL